MLLFFVSWWVLVTAVVLLVLKAWHWWDAFKDWQVVQRQRLTGPLFAQARGAMRLAWLRLMDGVLWLGLSGAVLVTEYFDAPSHLALPSRLTIELLMLVEMGKIVTERATRADVLHEIETRRPST